MRPYKTLLRPGRRFHVDMKLAINAWAGGTRLVAGAWEERTVTHAD
jgi:hypothetical protein